MSQVDMHVHSKFSHHASEWFLQRLGAAESYTEPQYIYDTARQRGMDFVTITDHNAMDGSFALNEMYPDTTFTGVESTAYFPEDGCKIHVLVYGLNRSQFDNIQHLRTNVYDLRDYLRAEDLAHSVAHATYSVNGRITIEHIEKLMVLFNTFEGINGSRSRLSNMTLLKSLENLTPERFSRLVEKHRLDPMTEDGWLKGFTGGSDDHAGVFIGKTYTTARGETTQDFIRALKNRRSFVAGRHNDFKSLALAIYKISYDFTKAKGENSGIGSTPLTQVSNYIFSQKRLGLLQKMKLNIMRSKGRGFENNIRRHLTSLIEEAPTFSSDDIEARLDKIYDTVASISDEFFGMFISSIDKHLENFDIAKLIKGVSGSIPGIFLSLPFFTAFNHMHNNRDIVTELNQRFLDGRRIGEKKILWFTDTLNDLNGVSVTLKNIGFTAEKTGRNIRIVTSLNHEELTDEIPPTTINLDPIHEVALPYYDRQKIKMPSLLDALKKVYDADPDEIVISTPGPVGLVGLMVSRLLRVPSVGVYHTDFTREADEIVGKEDLSALVESYTKWFFTSVSRLMVPTTEYIDILEERGFDRSRMSLFKRGLDSEMFSPARPGARKHGGVKLLYTGRISKDKNLEFLFTVFERVVRIHPDVSLTLVGDGPDMDEMKRKYRIDNRISFTGRTPNREMPDIYRSHDIFVFPSQTDTFGMSVLEAQSCGLPALVTDMGGPKEIVRDGFSGRVARADADEWTRVLGSMIDKVMQNDPEHTLMAQRARNRVTSSFDWNAVLAEWCDEDDWKRPCSEARELARVMKDKRTA